MSCGPERRSEQPHGGDLGRIVADSWDAAAGAVTVISGLHSVRLPLAGRRVSEVRASLQDSLDIRPDAAPIIDGKLVDEHTVLHEDQTLAFVRRAGQICG